MPPLPKFSEMQKVGPIAGEDLPWNEGIVIGLLWTGDDRPDLLAKLGSCWVYKLQTGPNDDLVDIWWSEHKLEAR